MSQAGLLILRISRGCWPVATSLRKKMISTFVALLLITGACSAYPHEEDTTVGPPPEGPVDPERGPFAALDVPVPAEASEDITAPEEASKPEASDLEEGTKPEESDLKTDATFWWPSYRSYWRYPRYRYYRPRTYYRYYYW